MADNTFIINAGLDNAFNLYNEFKDKEESIQYNSFMSSIVRMLIVIYGEDIVKAFESKDINVFDKEMLKYEYDTKEYNNFKLCVDKFYSFNIKTESKAIKKKNKYFNLVQKYLIDMLVQKNSKDKVSNEELEKFGDLLFTANSKSFYQKSYAVLVAYNPYEIYEYAKKQNIVGDGNEKDNNNK